MNSEWKTLSFTSHVVSALNNIVVVVVEHGFLKLDEGFPTPMKLAFSHHT